MKKARLTAIRKAIDVVNGLEPQHCDGALYLTCTDCRQLLIRAIAAAIQSERKRKGSHP